MRKILFIAPYPFDEAPSQRFRFEQYLQELTKNGYETEVHSFLSIKAWRTIYQPGKLLAKFFAMKFSFFRRFVLLFKLRQYHYIFIHREAAMIGPPIFEWFISKVLRRKYIFDFDDAIWLPNYSEANASFHRIKMYKKVEKIIRWADQVVAGNEFLAAYAKQFNPRVKVIPTTIDMDQVKGHRGNPETETMVIGWTGSHTTAQYLHEILPVLDAVHKKQAFTFRVISNQDPKLNRDYVEYIPWRRQSEATDLEVMHIGLMPLTDGEWAQGKCGFKALQYLSLEIPAIVSPVGVNTRIVENGVTGFLCETDEEWIERILQLLTDKTLRSEMGRKGKEYILNHYSKAANLPLYLELFKS